MDPSLNQISTSDKLDFSVGCYQDFAGLSAEFRTSFLQEERRCRYPSKRCELPRAIKRNGEMHRFCEIHRDRANFNQRRLEARRKLEIQEVEQTSRRSSSSSPIADDNHAKTTPTQDDKPWTDPCESSPPLHSVLAAEELNFLSELLSQNSLEDLHTDRADGEDEVSTKSSPLNYRFPC